MAVGAPVARVWAGLATIYVLWGSTYLPLRIAIETLPPLLMSSLRFLVAGAILYLVALRFGDGERDQVGGRQWLAAVATGGPLFLLGNGGVAWAQQYIDSGIAALLVATIPLWLAVLDRALFGRSLGAGAIVALGVGLGGVAILVAPTGADRIDPLGALVCLLAPFCWAAGTLYARGHDASERPLFGAGMQMLVGGVLLVVAGGVTGELGRVELGEASGASLAALAYLVVFGSLVAYTS